MQVQTDTLRHFSATIDCYTVPHIAHCAALGHQEAFMGAQSGPRQKFQFFPSSGMDAGFEYEYMIQVQNSGILGS